MRFVIPKVAKKTAPQTLSDAKAKALLIAEALWIKQAEDIILLCVEGLSSITDYYVICTAHSEPQMQALIDGTEDALREKGDRPLGIEGRDAAQWVLVDCNEVILHIFKQETRLFYNLDRLWVDAPRINYGDERETALKEKKPAPRKRKVS